MTASDPSMGGARVAPPLLALFAAVYALQGVVFAYVVTYNQLYMKAAGLVDATSNDIQTFAILLPFALKFLFGPLTDRVNLLGLGHRWPFIAIGVALQSAGLVGLGRIDPGRHVALYAAVALTTVLGLALYDTCCDGLIVDATPEADRPRVQSVTLVARFAASTVLTLGFGQIMERTGVGPGRSDWALFACAGLGLPVLLIAALVREPRRSNGHDDFDWRAFGALVRPSGLALIAFGLLYSMPGWAVEINLPSFYDAQGFGKEAIGACVAARFVGRGLGAVLLPSAIRLLGLRGAIAGGVLVMASALASQALIGWADVASAASFGFVLGASSGWNDVLFATLAMGAADRRLSASTFAVFMAVTNLNILGGSLFGRALREVGSFEPLFAVAGLMTLPALLILGPLGRIAPRGPVEDIPDADVA